MKNISVARLHELLDYDPETGFFVWKISTSDRVKIGDRAGYIEAQGYRVIPVDGVRCMAHRLVWLYVMGVLPVHQIDHIDGQRDNNAWNNLRDVGQQANVQNRRKPQRNNKSGYLGVSWQPRSNKWRAGIRLNGKGYHLGLFDNPAKAHEVYLEAKRRMHIGCTI